MARFLLSVTRGLGASWIGAGALLIAALLVPVTVDAAATNAAPAAPKAPVVAPVAAVSAPSTNKPSATPPPPPVQDTFNRYGKIVAPSDDVAHPLKLNVQFPGVGEMKIPSQDELNVRDKLEQLATLSDADIRSKLEEWPPYTKMNLRDEGQMLMRIQQFKEQRTKIAQQKAHDLGLSTLTPDQQVKFEKEYWDKRLQMDRELTKQFEPIMKARDQKLREALFREFSPPNTGGPPGPKPANPPIAQAKPPTPPPAPVVQNKPAPPAPPAPTANSLVPTVGQGPTKQIP